MNLVFIGLTLSSSWGNGHAVTYRALLKALAARGHDILFLERDAPWYAAHRDLTSPDYCGLGFYDSVADLGRWHDRIAEADAVIVGSYVPDGIEIGRLVQNIARGPVAFYDIDTPITLAAVERGDCAYLAAELIGGYDVYFSFTGGPTLDRLERHYRSPAARALYCSADPEIYRPTETTRRWDLSYLGTYSDDRQPALDRLLLEAARRAPSLRFAVAGPLYPADIDWPENVERLEHVGPADHPAFYGASRFTLNITRADMAAAGFSPSVRLFEAAACGTAILSDAWDGLGTLLTPGTDIVTVAGAADILAALELDDAARLRIAGAGRRRVLDAHTPGHRAETVERELRLCTRRVQARRAPAVAAVGG